VGVRVACQARLTRQLFGSLCGKPTAEEFSFLLPSYPCSSVFICGQFLFVPEVGPLDSSAKAPGCLRPQSSVRLEGLFDRPAAIAIGALPPKPPKVGLESSRALQNSTMSQGRKSGGGAERVIQS